MPLSRATGPDEVLRVLAMVAHELRSPLAGITGTLATLRQRSQQLTQAEREELLGLAIAVDAAGALRVRADADAVHAVLANLLDNAARHTPADTQVWVEAARHGQVAVLAVEDAGPGIPT